MMKPVALMWISLLLASPLWGAEAGVRVQISLAGNPPSALAGELVSWDDTRIVLKIGSDERTIEWIAMEPLSAFRTRSRLIDRENATHWLDLATMGWSMGLEEPARDAISRGLRIDPDVAEKSQAITARPSGWALPDAAAAPAAVAAETPVIPHTQDTPEPAPTTQPRDLIEYTPSTPEQDEAAIEAARRRAADVEARLGMKLAEFQTPHFIVFTDWDPREYRFLEQNLEGAYRAVAKVFDYDPKQNIFEGKLAIYMFAHRGDFRRFGQLITGMTEVPERMAGYFAWRGQIIYMAMWKPDMAEPRVTKEIAELKWAYVLAHEFVHAFIYRYKTNRVPPLWVNEGLAETVAMRMFPVMSDYSMAGFMAATTPTLLPMFDHEALQREFSYYPVHRTLIETLIARDRKAFIRWFNDIKYGMDAEEALKKHFGWDYATYERMWRRYVAAVQ